VWPALAADASVMDIFRAFSEPTKVNERTSRLRTTTD
jgi:hypothetical protein